MFFYIFVGELDLSHSLTSDVPSELRVHHSESGVVQHCDCRETRQKTEDNSQALARAGHLSVTSSLQQCHQPKYRGHGNLTVTSISPALEMGHCISGTRSSASPALGKGCGISNSGSSKSSALARGRGISSTRPISSISGRGSGTCISSTGPPTRSALGRGRGTNSTGFALGRECDSLSKESTPNSSNSKPIFSTIDQDAYSGNNSQSVKLQDATRAFRFQYHNLVKAVQVNPLQVAVQLYSCGFISEAVKNAVSTTLSLSAYSQANTIVNELQHRVVIDDNPAAVLIEVCTALRNTGLPVLIPVINNIRTALGELLHTMNRNIPKL